MDALDYDCPVRTTIDGVEADYFMNGFPNPEAAKELCRILNSLPHPSFPQRSLHSDNGKSFVGVVVHGVTIEDFCKKQANLFFDEWDEQKVQPSNLYIQIIRALVDALDMVKNQEINLVLNTRTVYISVDKKSNPHIYLVKYGVEGGKEHTQSLKELIVSINSSVEAPEALMSGFLHNLESFKGDFDTLLEDADLMRSEERIEFIMELSSLLDNPRNADMYTDDNGAFKNIEDIIKKDAKLSFLKYAVDKFGETQKAARGGTIFAPTPTDKTKLTYRVRFPRNGFIHFMRIILRYKVEALGFRNPKELQLMFEKHFPGHIRKLKPIHQKLKEQSNKEMFCFELRSEVKSKEADLSTEDLVVQNFFEMCEDQVSKSIKLKQEQEKLNQGRKINQPLWDNKQTKKADPFGQARPREENLESKKAVETQKPNSVMKFVPEVDVVEVFPGRPPTWFEAKLDKHIAGLETMCKSGGIMTEMETEMIVFQNLRNKFIEKCNDSVRYDRGK